MTEVAVEQLPEHLRTKAAVVENDVPQTVDYFDFHETHDVTLPNGWSVTVKVLNEGERRRYLNQTNRDVKMDSKTKTLIMRSQVGDDENTLLSIAVVDWAVVRDGKPLAFNKGNLQQALDKWPPAAWAPVLKKIREINDWLMGTEDDLEALEDEYRDLGERIQRIKDGQAKD